MIKIEPSIKEKFSKLKLGIITCNTKICSSNPQLLSAINIAIETMKPRLSNEAIRELSTVKHTKNAYRLLGKDPNRYRPAAESLLRRITNGKGLYKINNVVDVLNLVSIQTGYSIGGYDLDKTEGNIKLGIGQQQEDYQGIGRGYLNIENLPVLRDSKGAIGSPTSDSVRTMVTDNTNKFLMVFYDFEGESVLEECLNSATQLLEKYTEASNFDKYIIQ